MPWNPPGGGYWGDDIADIFESANPARLDPGPEFGEQDENIGKELFYDGWVNSDISPDERSEARESFLDWMMDWGLEAEDFPWDDWRDWYEAA